MINNLSETPSPGTYPDMLFCVSDYLGKSAKIDATKGRHGINPITFNIKISKNNDAPGFLNAIFEDLFKKSFISNK